jgi:hypothetical protein
MSDTSDDENFAAPRGAAGENAGSPTPGHYEVGYCKPPTATRFSAGHKVNAGKTRKKRPPSFEEQFRKELSKKVTVRRGGELEKIKISEAVLQRVLADALAGKSYAQKLVLSEIRILFPAEAADNSRQLAEDEEIIRNLFESMRAKGGDD